MYIYIYIKIYYISMEVDVLPQECSMDIKCGGFASRFRCLRDPDRCTAGSSDGQILKDRGAQHVVFG